MLCVKFDPELERIQGVNGAHTLVVREHCLDVAPLISDVHDELALRQHLEGRLSSWGLMPQADEARVFITADRGTNIKAAITNSQWATFIPCLRHVLHRVVLTALAASGS